MKKPTFILIIIALIASGIVLGSILDGTQSPSKEVSCTPESRQGEFCPQVYDPVCGWFDDKEVQCITYPCADTYSNSCFACLDKNVEHWTKGVCPT